MKRKEHITAFYIETLILILVFVGIILVLTQIFGIARRKSVEAEEKTSAISLCQNAAEAFAAADSGQELLDLLNVKENAELEVTGDRRGRIEAGYDRDMTPNARGKLRLALVWEPDTVSEKETAGQEKVLLRATITAKRGELSLYTLETAAYGKEGWK